MMLQDLRKWPIAAFRSISCAPATRTGSRVGDESGTARRPSDLTRWTGWVGAGLVVVLLGAGVPGKGAPAAVDLPFFPGEVLQYRMRVGGIGTVGHGTMSVRSASLRGEPVYLLSSDFSGRFGPIRGESESHSWLDPQRFVALRFEKSEHSPMAREEESVDLYPSEQRWVTDGQSGHMSTDQPLDELSFIYLLRTLDLAEGRSYRISRHYEPGRNPVDVTVLGRDTVEVEAGRFEAFVVEMRVRDPQRYRGEGVITLELSTGPRRIPLRIETRLPGMGRTLLTLESDRTDLATADR